MRTNEAMEHVGLKHSAFYARQSRSNPGWDPTFPRKTKLGPDYGGATVYYERELDEWLASKRPEAPQESDQ